MTVVMFREVTVVPFAPESNRERLYYADYGSIYEIKDGPDMTSNGGMSVEMAKSLYKDLDCAEATSIYLAWVAPSPASVVGQPAVTVDLRGVDGDWFKVFDYTFVDGKPFDNTDVESIQKKAVISESLARKLYGRTNIVGEEVLLARVPYVVSGVVKNVSTLATKAYSDAWVPYSTLASSKTRWWDVMGSMSAVILAKEGVTNEMMQEECIRRYDKYNEELASTGRQLLRRGRPYNQEAEAVGAGANQEADPAPERRERLTLLAILLIVPAINLSSMTHSRLRQRRAEVGVKRAFGATRGNIIMEILVENMIVTLAAGVIGFAISVAIAYLFSAEIFERVGALLANEPKIDLSILIHFSTFAWVLGACFLLNVLSSGLPAWQASRTNVVNAIKGE